MVAKTLACSIFVGIQCLLILAGRPVVAAEPRAAAASDTARLNPVFAPQSFWYQPIAPDAKVDPDSEKLMAAFNAQRAKENCGIVAINTVSYASPIYIAEADTPRIGVCVDHCCDLPSCSDFAGLALRFAAVPMPAVAEPACGTDSEMTVFQPSTDTMWEFWRAKKNANGEWQACWGGRMDRVSKSCGIWPNPTGTTATGLPFAGGQITPEELAAGKIEHVIGIAIPYSQGFVWPANRSDGPGCNGDICIRQGSRIQLAPSVGPECFEKMHPVCKAIAKAAQAYGFVVWDTASTVSLRAKNPKSYTRLGLGDPYPELFCPDNQDSVLKEFPWDKIQFVAADQGCKSDDGK